MPYNSAQGGRSGSDTPTNRSKRVVALAAVAVLSAAAVVGMLALYRFTLKSAPAKAATTASVELRVSRDFGARALFDERPTLPEQPTVMSLLAANAKVDTGYSGGFVNAINGVASGFSAGKREDWFFFVNGLQSDRGAADFRLTSGDRVWWDFHQWDFAPSVPAVVGQFPQPFASSTLPTVVEYSQGYAPIAEKIAASLREAGARDVSVAAVGGRGADRHRLRVLVGTWSQVAGDQVVADGVKKPGSSGLFARIEDGKLVALNNQGEPSAYSKRAGLVMATAAAERPREPVWIVTGSQASDVDAAAGLLENGGPKLQGRFGVAVLSDSSVVALPKDGPR